MDTNPAWDAGPRIETRSNEHGHYFRVTYPGNEKPIGSGGPYITDEIAAHEGKLVLRQHLEKIAPPPAPPLYDVRKDPDRVAWNLFYNKGRSMQETEVTPQERQAAQQYWLDLSRRSVEVAREDRVIAQSISASPSTKDRDQALSLER